MSTKILRTLCALAAASVIQSGNTSGEVTGGDVIGGSSGGVFALLDPPPSDAGPDSFQSPDLIAFDEQQDLGIAATISVGGVLIPAGSIVSSHYIAFDPLMASTIEGYVDFDEPIIAILGSPNSLQASAGLFGLPSVNYSTGPAIGADPMDAIAPSAVLTDRLDFAAGASSPGDHVRVLTGYLAPEPGSITIASGVALFLLPGRVRKSHE